MALDVLENQALLDTLNSERFVDTAPAAVHATLLDEGRYLGSVRTMYRLLARTGASPERQPTRSPGLHQARAAGRCSQPGLVLGHHQASRTDQVDVLAPVRDSGYLQPLCRGLVDRRA
jgi:hypothetical protein